MIRIFKQLLDSQKGQALPIVLCMLAIGGLTIAGSLSYATTNVNGSRITVEGLQGTYAAEAGIELGCITSFFMGIFLHNVEH